MRNTLNNAPKIVLNSYAEVDDIFTRFEFQLNQCWLKSIDKQEELIVADPKIKTLKAIENFVLDIEYQNTPDLTMYHHYLESKNTAKLHEFQRYFNKIRYIRDQLTSNSQLSEKANITLNACRQIELEHRADNIIDPLLSLSSFNFMSGIPIDLDNQSERLLALIENISTKLESPKVQAKIRERRVLASINFNDAIELVDDCFKACPQLFIICMDLGYPSQRKQPYSVNPSENCGQIHKHWSDLAALLDNEIGIIGHFEKLEYTAQRGHSLHCTFLFAHQKRFSEDDLAMRIGKLWMDITQRAGAYHNCNAEILARVSNHAVGLIKDTETTKRNALKRFVIGYSTLSSQYLSAASNNEQVFLLKKQPPSALSVSQITSEKVKSQKIISAFVLTQKESEQALKINTVSLSADLVSQIKEMPIVYSELAARLQNHNQLLPTDFVEHGFFSVESLIQIEAFIAYVRDCDKSAFVTFNPARHGNPTEKEALKWRTLLGKQLIALYSQWNLAYVTSALLPNFKYLSPSVKIYCAVVCSEYEWRMTENIRADDSVHSKMHFFNCFIEQVRQYLKSDYRYFLDQLKNIQVPLTDSVFTGVRSNYGNLLTPTEPNTLAIKQFIGDVANQKNSNATKPLRTQSIQAFIVEQNKNAQTIFSDALKYTNVLFKKDVTLFSLKFFININHQDIPHQIFAQLLTLFLRNGKNMKPLAWSYGYLGRWEHATELQRCAHIIFFLDADLAKDIKKVTQEIQAYWIEIVRSKGAEVIRNYLAKPDSIQFNESELSNLQGHTECYQISTDQDDFSDFHCTINRDKKELQSLFKKFVLLYLTKSTLYFQPNQSDVPKALIKGQLGTTKLNINKKWRNPEDTAKFRTKSTTYEITPLQVVNELIKTSISNVIIETQAQQDEIINAEHSHDEDQGSNDAPILPLAGTPQDSTFMVVNTEKAFTYKQIPPQISKNSKERRVNTFIVVPNPHYSPNLLAGQNIERQLSKQVISQDSELPVLNDQQSLASNHAPEFALNKSVEDRSDHVDAAASNLNPSPTPEIDQVADSSSPQDVAYTPESPISNLTTLHKETDSKVDISKRKLSMLQKGHEWRKNKKTRY